jgi:hypothetical protein
MCHVTRVQTLPGAYIVRTAEGKAIVHAIRWRGGSLGGGSNDLVASQVDHRSGETAERADTQSRRP